MTPAPAGRARAVLAVPAAALSLIAGLSFDGAFELAAIWRMCLVCAAVPAVVAAGALVRRERPLPLALTLAAMAVGWLAAVPALARTFAVPGTPLAHASLTAILRAGLTDAAKQLLTTAPPAVPTAALLAALGTLVWWASAWSAEAAVRGGAPLLPALPPALVLLAGTAAGVPRGSASQLWPAALFLAVLTVLLAAERALRRPRPAGHGEPGLPTATLRVVPALALAMAVTGLAVILTPRLPGLASRSPADPRQLVRPPPRAESLINPLSLVTAWLSAPSRPLFTVRTAHPVNVRWLVLDRYNGQEWTSGARYVPAGTELPGGGSLVAGSRLVTEHVQVAGLPGTWLPAAGQPVRLTGVAARVDAAGGVLATLNGSAANGLAYVVTSNVPAPSLGDLVNAVPGSGPGLAAQTTLPAGLPAGVSAYGDRAVYGAAYPYQQMVLLQDRLLGDFRYDPKAVPGESYGSLAYFVSQRTGGPSQFATLFAVLARHAGFPSRIAIGFLPGRRTGPQLYQVTTHDVLVWPEVYFTGLGWVPFYPLPQPGSHATREQVRALGQPAGLSRLDQRIAQARPVARHQSRRPRIAPLRPASHGTPTDPGAVAIWALAIPAGAAALYLGAAAAGRALVRRRWRRGPGARRQVAGAWQDTLGRLAAAEAGPLTILTPDEIVERAVTTVGLPAREPMSALAALASAALFSPRPLTSADAGTAWQAARQIRRLSRRRTRWWHQAICLLRPVPPGPSSRGRT